MRQKIFLQELKKIFKRQEKNFLTDNTETNLFFSRDKNFFSQMVISFADVLCIKQKEGTKYSLKGKKNFQRPNKNSSQKKPKKKKQKCKTS